MTAPGYRLVGNERYPNAIADYRITFTRLRQLSPHIPLASHGNFFDLQKKIAAMRSGATNNPFIDPDGYRSLIASLEQRFETMVREQSAP